MNTEYENNIKAQRPANWLRIFASFIFIVVSYVYDFKIILIVSLMSLIPDFLWLYLIEKHYAIYEKNINLWYIASSIDTLVISIFVYLTGTAYSPVILAYIVTATLSSTDLIRARGLYSTLSGSFTFLFLLVMVQIDIFPVINILSVTPTKPGLFASILAFLLLMLSSLSSNAMIYTIYCQYNEKNIELAKSLDEIKKLKNQQDGDYYLTLILLEPLLSNQVNSSKFLVEIIMDQYKKFQFRNKSYAIGGDVCISDTLMLNGDKYIIFANADAMGKSSQGAGGSLVFSSVLKSILLRTKSNIDNTKIIPGNWLIETFNELQSVFESFEGLMLVSAIIGLIDEKSGKLYFINAEHPFAILYRDKKADFLENSILYRKLGTPEINKNPNLKTFSLFEGDVIFIGSDGKDDLLLPSVTENVRNIDNDENRFLEVIEKTNGDLNLIIPKLQEYGKRIDDLSILRIEYKN